MEIAHFPLLTYSAFDQAKLFVFSNECVCVCCFTLLMGLTTLSSNVYLISILCRSLQAIIILFWWDFFFGAPLSIRSKRCWSLWQRDCLCFGQNVCVYASCGISLSMRSLVLIIRSAYSSRPSAIWQEKLLFHSPLPFVPQNMICCGLSINFFAATHPFALPDHTFCHKTKHPFLYLLYYYYYMEYEAKHV